MSALLHVLQKEVKQRFQNPGLLCVFLFMYESRTTNISRSNCPVLGFFLPVSQISTRMNSSNAGNSTDSSNSNGSHGHNRDVNIDSNGPVTPVRIVRDICQTLLRSVIGLSP